jgi:xanthine dehydrogenase small subunit
MNCETAMRDHLLLFINGRQVSARGDEMFMTLSDFLRRRQRLTGTKVVCAEGDCGACAVLIGRPSDDGSRLVYTSVNSCIQRMFQLDATHIVTVEGLKDGASPSPVQEAMARCHGAQCGFCTPGMVVGLHDLMQSERPLTAHSVQRGLVGNLCRCTGYDSIIHAALEVDRSKVKSIDRLYPPKLMLAALVPAAGEEVRIDAGKSRFSKPASVPAALRFRRENPGCLIVTGATDIGVQCNKGTRQLSVVMATHGLKELRTISATSDALCVGACASLTQLEEITAEHLPEMSRFLALFGSPLIKNAGTLAGNLVNASPIADTIPALFALNGEIEVASERAGTRWVNVHQFYTGYRQTILAPDEMVTRVRIPLPADGEIFKLYKVSRRRDLDIASFGAAVWMRRSGRRIDDIRIAYGGVGPMVVRMNEAEAILRGNVASLELFEQAGAAARRQVQPISDVRGSDEYRRALAENILVKFWYDLGDSAADNGSPANAPAAGIRGFSMARSAKTDLP